MNDKKNIPRNHHHHPLVHLCVPRLEKVILEAERGRQYHKLKAILKEAKYDKNRKEEKDEVTISI